MGTEQFDWMKRAAGVGEVDPVGTLASEYDRPADGRWYVGIHQDGRVVVYDDTEESIEIIAADGAVETQSMYSDTIEGWVNDAIVDGRVVELHPRYIWIKRMAQGEFFEE